MITESPTLLSTLDTAKENYAWLIFVSCCVQNGEKNNMDIEFL